MIKIDWRRDYQGEFFYPYCNKGRMSLSRVSCSKKQFRCSTCSRTCIDSHQLNIQAVPDPINLGVFWYTNQKIKDFVCPNCQAKDIYFSGVYRKKKRVTFRCKKCEKTQYNWLRLTRANVSKLSSQCLAVKNFNFDEDKWDLRAINPKFDARDIRYSTINFCSIHPEWLKQEVKKYIQHLCKAGKTFGTIGNHLSALRSFSYYLNQTNVSSFQQINRSLVLDYLGNKQKLREQKIGSLRNFLTIGTLKGWFNIDQDIIRNDDYSNQYKGNPDPLSGKVCEQIEQNLHQLPDPIARMWLICYFAAMRPSELALLCCDCLMLEGEYWKLVWHRKKTNDYHEVPISRTIAKVVQEQQQYIQNLWGKDWDYLFCHYHGLFSTNLKQLKLEPVKKVIPSHPKNPFSFTIRYLIQALNIRDENGQLAKFSPKLLRPTRLTQLFEQGHDLAVVSAWAGHKHFATTSTYYTEVSCELMEREAGHIQKALVNSDGQHLPYESLPKSFWKTPTAHKLELSGMHINTPIYGFCGLSLNQDCYKFRACYTCSSFVATPEKLSQYILTRDELRTKESGAKANGQEVLVEQFGRQADQLDKIIAGLQEAV